LKKFCCGLLFLSLIVLLAACGTVASTRSSSSSSITSDSLGRSVQFSPAPTPTSIPMLSIPSQITTPTPRIIPTSAPKPTPPPPPASNCITFSNDTTQVPPKNGGLGAPYGPSPVTTEAQQITGELFQLVNHDREACGLPPFAWNATLASGALLHSWNEYHCGLSHTCPDGMTQYQRIANEGFAGYPDCGENIALAGPYPTPWGGVYAVQESMAHEPLGGWHRIHLFSTTLHQIGIGVYVAPNGWLWFTEDMTS
ncbi:MAG TPA: CAP domain-containing protein, partial [Ktedonobacteraceae bacterium]|nr:CAP domain-containing protein [Ktedonobacteraceae bacterium]